MMVIWQGVTGERAIFKRRIPPEKHSPNFHPQNKPKRIRFVMDISASTSISPI